MSITADSKNYYNTSVVVRGYSFRLKNNEERQFPGARIYMTFIAIINPGILVTYQSVRTVGLL